MNNSPQKLIALLTDFGARGMHYVASMKGVILKINPLVNIIDVTHAVSPFSIIEASYIIKITYRHYPEGTIFMIVIDPGVGSNREILVLQSKSNYYFIGPNNGIFSTIADMDHVLECIEIKNDYFFNHPVSSTFHGRDIMAPVAAYISKGIKLNEFGPNFDLSDLVHYSTIFNVDEINKVIEATVLYMDDFGNIALNIPMKDNYIDGTSIHLTSGAKIDLMIGTRHHRGTCSTHFSAVPEGTLLFSPGSNNYLEISKNQGNASLELGCRVGDVVTLSLN